MKNILLIAILFVSSLPLTAQSFGLQWIGAGTSTADYQLWFRRAFTTDHTPQCAHIELATTGRFRLYVNQYNVSRNVLLPYRQEGDTSTPISQTFDITPYLRPDTNTVAIWYAPSHWQAEGEPQIAACIYGTDSEDTPFAFHTDADWTWSHANACSRWIDATAYRPDWNTASPSVIPWQHAVETSSPDTPTLPCSPYARRVLHEVTPAWTNKGKDSIEAGFPVHIKGWIRVTLRGAKAGETITVNQLTYRCDGTMDEQVCRRFTTESTDRVVIKGDSHFKPEQVQNIEGLQIGEITAY